MLRRHAHLALWRSPLGRSHAWHPQRDSPLCEAVEAAPAKSPCAGLDVSLAIVITTLLVHRLDVMMNLMFMVVVKHVWASMNMVKSMCMHTVVIF